MPPLPRFECVSRIRFRLRRRKRLRCAGLIAHKQSPPAASGTQMIAADIARDLKTAHGLETVVSAARRGKARAPSSRKSSGRGPRNAPPSENLARSRTAPDAPADRRPIKLLPPHGGRRPPPGAFDQNDRLARQQRRNLRSRLVLSYRRPGPSGPAVGPWRPCIWAWQTMQLLLDLGRGA